MSKRQARKRRLRFSIMGHGTDGQANQGYITTVRAYSAKQALFLFDRQSGASQLSCVWNQLTAVEEVSFDILQDTGDGIKKHVMTISAPNADIALELFARRIGYKFSTIKEQCTAQIAKT